MTAPPTPEQRAHFHAHDGRELACQVLGDEAVKFYADRPVSKTISIWVTPDDERIAVVVCPGERPTDIDKALAYGLTFQVDRDLHVVLPDDQVTVKSLGTFPAALPTLQRVAYLTTPVFVWTHRDTGKADGPSAPRIAEPQIVPPRHQVRESLHMDDVLKVTEHVLGEERAAWIDPISDVVSDEFNLDFSPRQSYLAWHSGGRQVLKVIRATSGVRVTAGVSYSKPVKGKTMGTVIELTGPPTEAQVSVIRRAIQVAIAEHDAGAVGENLEHRLQARLAKSDGVASLGLVGRLEREVPASRPGHRRAFIDLMGVDSKGDIHVIETKIDSDPMLALQGLDYWVWATEYKSELIKLLKSRGHKVKNGAKIHVDFVVGTKTDQDTADIRYLVRQLEALDGGITWRIGEVRGWLHPSSVLTIDWASRRMFPPDQVPKYPRFVTRLQRHLIEHHTGTGAIKKHQVMLRDVAAALPSEALPVYERLTEADQLHTYFRHVRSSQQFAVAVFGALHGEALLRVAREIEPAIVLVESMEFEFVDPADRLGESTKYGHHLTQADVAIRARFADGKRHLALIEVKLSEERFSGCSGYEDPKNDRFDGCGRTDAFASGPVDCFQLANYNRGGERFYERYVSARPDDRMTGCPFRTSNNQPMRNMALAQALVDVGEYDSASFVLCAHDGHRSIWRRWDEFKAVAVSRSVTCVDLPASHVLQALEPDVSQVLSNRYGLSLSDTAESTKQHLGVGEVGFAR